jgi:hypothetical protein
MKGDEIRLFRENPAQPDVLLLCPAFFACFPLRD